MLPLRSARFPTVEPDAFKSRAWTTLTRIRRRRRFRNYRPVASSPRTVGQVSDLPADSFTASEPYDQAQLLSGRREGHFLVSYETPGGWTALKKDLLTEILGAGRDARIARLPPDAAQVLRLMCPDLRPRTGLIRPACRHRSRKPGL